MVNLYVTSRTHDTSFSGLRIVTGIAVSVRIGTHRIVRKMFLTTVVCIWVGKCLVKSQSSNNGRNACEENYEYCKSNFATTLTFGPSSGRCV